MAECINCEEEYADKRAELGYSTCLDCGEADARVIAQVRAQTVLSELTPYVSGSLTQPDALFDERPGYNTESITKRIL
jgi:hypothetical protein